MNKLDLHTLSIGLSLQSPISIDDNCRRDQWMIRHIRELFALAKMGIIANESAKKAALICHDCETTGLHSTENCPHAYKHIPLFPELESK